MSIHCKLMILVLALTLNDQVSAGKIVGGHEAAAHSRPYMVLVETHKESGEEKYCGGFLVNEDFVMTAAHCFAYTYRVFLGMHNFEIDRNRVQSVAVTQAFPHNDYNSVTYQYDVMLLKLASKAKFSDHVKPIALASHNDSSPNVCQIAGWGKTTRGSKFLSKILMEADVIITPKDVCEEEHLYCSEGDVGPGEGDSGGPLVCNGKAYGVISGTFKPKDGSILNRFAKIPDNQKWITSTIRKLR